MEAAAVIVDGLDARCEVHRRFGAEDEIHVSHDGQGDSDTTSRQHAYRQSIQQQMAARSPVAHANPGVVRSTHVTESRGHVASKLPATPWEEDEQGPTATTDSPVQDAFQDPFEDRAARRRPAVQVKFKLDQPQTVPAGFQRLEDLLLEDEQPEETPAAAPDDEFSPAFPALPQDTKPVPPEANESDLTLPAQPLPDMDEISPFQTETEPSEDRVPPLDLTQPESQDDAIRLPEPTPRSAGTEDRLPEDTLQPPPLPGQDARPRQPSRNNGLPELRFRDEIIQPNGVPQDQGDEYRFGEEDGGDERREEGDVPCERKYNQRNCCQEDQACRRVIQAAEARVIQKISLDISPPFELDERGVPTDEDKQQKLSKISSRTWTSRDHQILATGSLTDLRAGNVIVVNEDGVEQSIRFEALSRDDLCFVTAYWNLPAECPLPGDNYALRDFTMITYTWTASALCHKPLYFENVSLERYGHSAGPGRQPLLSAAHFFGSVILLPYNLRLYPPTECQYALGYYEPGDCAPWLVHAFPLSKRAALGELSFALGLWGFIN